MVQGDDSSVYAVLNACHAAKLRLEMYEDMCLKERQIFLNYLIVRKSCTEYLNSLLRYFTSKYQKNAAFSHNRFSGKQSSVHDMLLVLAMFSNIYNFFIHVHMFLLDFLSIYFSDTSWPSLVLALQSGQGCTQLSMRQGHLVPQWYNMYHVVCYRQLEIFLHFFCQGHFIQESFKVNLVSDESEHWNAKVQSDFGGGIPGWCKTNLPLLFFC